MYLFFLCALLQFQLEKNVCIPAMSPCSTSSIAPTSPIAHRLAGGCSPGSTQHRHTIRYFSMHNY